MHIAVILPRWVGDAVMATPLLRTLRTHFGGSARITGVMRPVIADLLDGTGWIDDVIPYDRHGRNPARWFRPAARALRAARADVGLVLPNSLSAATLAFAGAARRRVGHPGHWRRPLLTHVVPPRRGADLQPPAGHLDGRDVDRAVTVELDDSILGHPLDGRSELGRGRHPPRSRSRGTHRRLRGGRRGR
jgi:ADP-heptose:LPS heptosyltransferase